ncbi:phage tail protein [Yersinia enterocolitica]|uniref:phage tail protein n=1 Tax=Yersinia enterocolitica TaxID=630 RepID=UPI0021ADF369|nr:phage tail protein [Yersinia enterocolitica]
MIIGFGNNVVSSLASDITASQIRIAVMPGMGKIFQKLLTTDISNDSISHNIYAKITLTDSQQSVYEICHLIGVSQDILTVVRGQEGTTAKGWSLNDVVANFATRGSEQHFVQVEQLQAGDYLSAVAGGTDNNLTISLPSTSSANDWVLRSPILVLPTKTNTGQATLMVTLAGRVMGTYPLCKGNNVPLWAGDIVKNVPIVVVFAPELSSFLVLNPGNGVVDEALFLKKSANGADIPDKVRFIENLGLRDTVNKAAGALQKSQNGADIPEKNQFAHNINVFTQAESDARYLKVADNLPVGIPLPWPLIIPPVGWFACHGQAFDKTQSPQLAMVYPSGVLPDLRGVFIRGWDNGRNLDGGRALLSFQGDAIRNITGFYIQTLAGSSYWNGYGGAFYQEGNAFGHHAVNSGANGATTKRFDASRVVPTANENRPVNMAFNYIVRAA